MNRMMHIHEAIAALELHVAVAVPAAAEALRLGKACGLLNKETLNS